MKFLEFLFPPEPEKILVGYKKLGVTWIDVENEPTENAIVYFYEQGNRKFYEIDVSGGTYLIREYGKDGSKFKHRWLAEIAHKWIRGVYDTEHFKLHLDSDKPDPDPKGKEPKPKPVKKPKTKAEGNIVPFKKAS